MNVKNPGFPLPLPLSSCNVISTELWLRTVDNLARERPSSVVPQCTAHETFESGQGPPQTHQLPTPTEIRETAQALSFWDSQNEQRGGCQLHVHSSGVTKTTDQFVNSSVRWPMHVCNRPFAQSAAEHGAPCVSPCSQQVSLLLGFLALASAFGGFSVLGTPLRVLVLALALDTLLAFALAVVLLH